ncbi:MAG: hypothetical protein ACYSR5_09240 [Planctomycetota bacterium]
MPRVARTVVAGVPHYITQRGNCRGNVFFTDSDPRTSLVPKGEAAYSDLGLGGP